MEIKKLSASAYKRHNFCPMAYFIEYNLNYRFPAGKAANLGTIAHSILESLARIKLGLQNNQSEVDTEIGILPTTGYDIDRILDDTYLHFINKEDFKVHIWEPIDYKNVRKFVENALNHNNGAFNPLNRKIISTEQYIKLDVNEDWAILPDGERFKITGFIDLVTEVDKNTIEITDYKTGSLDDFITGKRISYETLYDDIQLRMYHLALANIYGCDKNFILTMFFLKFSTPITISFDCNDLPQTLERIKTKFIEIYNTKIPKLNKTWDRPMSKCRKFCDFGKKEWPGNSMLPKTVQFIDGQVSSVGSNMCYCDAINYEMNRRGPEWVTENLGKYEI